MENREALVALNMIDHVGPVRVRQLLEFFGSASAILKASRQQLLQVHGIGEDTADAIVSWEKTVDLAAELKRAADYGCRVVTQEDEEYPRLLREIYDPPIVLYVKGTLLPQDRNSVAIVGSRQTTHYGIEVARKLSYQLAYIGVTVVSGGARGIDTAAHQGALSAKGRTLCVLGTGINIVFPPENRELFERISASGAVLTQYPFNRNADKQSFAIRNRIVAGMTLGTVVVEANLTSGALITTNFATEYGRQVFAVPGRIDSPRSKGCHELIKKGAKLCEGAEDILSEFEYLFPPRNRPPSPAETGVLPALELSEHEQRLLGILSAEQQSIDEVIRQSGLPSSTVSVALLGLEMKRLVKQLPGKMFVRN
ncbi:MAG TPA: DNA-protecting protein DprA [Verrucomicrobia bacterium]|nr:DNA-protecting protein DprA [Verrucomicrobiota bacterium]HOB32086.1 DNA-processing protein DprA [Verrucomicrobiota bacterium]HOP98609.1 DNA-processing protein DprA [Verrucomicrobiota bacterium]HPU55026.1 DNA-processing protein DprA [Verrucomicrobiota bacterium]